jgi:hypothetical protein
MSATQYDPQDILVGPIIQALATAIQTQIPSIQTVYLNPTDSVPDNNSVQFPYELGLDDKQYPGILRVNLEVYVTHLFKRTRLDLIYQQMQPYIYPWLMVLSAWRNQYLVPDITNGFATEFISFDKKFARIVPMNIGGQPYVALVIKICMCTDLPVDTNES